MSPPRTAPPPLTIDSFVGPRRLVSSPPAVGEPSTPELYAYECPVCHERDNRIGAPRQTMELLRDHLRHRHPRARHPLRVVVRYLGAQDRPQVSAAPDHN